MAIINFSDFTPGNLTQTVTLVNNRRVVGDAGPVNFTVTDGVSGTTNTFTDNEFILTGDSESGHVINPSALSGGSGNLTSFPIPVTLRHLVTEIDIEGVDEDGNTIRLPIISDSDGTVTPYTITARPNTQTATEIMLANGFDTKVTVVLTIGTDVQTMVLEAGQVRVISSTSGQNAEVSVTLSHTRSGGRGRVDNGDRLFAATYLYG